MESVFSIFPKFYNNYDVRQLADLVREAGLDTVNVVIRDGYWVTPGGMASELPIFVNALRKECITPDFATAGFDISPLVDDPDPLSIMADNGITEFRTGYFMVEHGDVRKSLESARNQVESLVPLCELYGIKAVYQLHHTTLIPNPSAAWILVNGLPSKWFGIELDPGNQSFEGYEAWHRSAHLLGDYVAAIGVKDSALIKDPERASDPDKGWSRNWAPIYEGVNNWHEVVRALSSINFRGKFVFMPFYDEHDQDAMTQKLKAEVAYLRAITDQY
ncbi:MAG: sugar phosphate isomerase/epimerase family protein [Armatimonadota bacterium]